MEVAGPGMADHLATDTVFLCSKRESDECNSIQVGGVTRERIKGIIANAQLHVAQMKKVAITRTIVLARSYAPKKDAI
jgi:hypothetical protein